MVEQLEQGAGTVLICGHHGNALVWINDEVEWRCADCFPEYFDSKAADQATTVSKELLLKVQAGLLAVSNYASGVHGGRVDFDDEAAWRAQVGPFMEADAIIRRLLSLAEADVRGFELDRGTSS